MQSFTLVVLAALVAVAYAGGQFYVPRAYYTIDAEGHESAPVPLRRLRRSLPPPYPYNSGASANANANANAYAGGGGDARANANANANARAGTGSYGIPAGVGSSGPLLTAGMTRTQSGPIYGRSVQASSSVGLDSSGNGAYEQTASVSN